MSLSGRPGGDPPAPGPSPVEDLRRRLAAEEAGTAYWREVARQRRVDAATVQRRPIVRAAIALDRRSDRLQAAAARRATATRALGARTALRFGALRTGARRTGRAAALTRQLEARASGAPVVAGDEPSILVVRIGAPRSWPGQLEGFDVVDLEPIGDGPEPLTARIDAAVAASDASLVCLLGPGTEPRHADWWAPLVDACIAPVVATVAMVVHPTRPWRSATAYDGAVRSLGLEVVVDGDGAPVPRAIGAGTDPDPALPTRAVALASASAVVVDRRAWQSVGGLGRWPEPADLDAAVVDLGLRLRADGGEIRAVPAAVVVDETPVAEPARLDHPLDPSGPGWRSVVEAHGPALVRLAATPGRSSGGPGDGPPSIALTTAVPSRKLVGRSGDWHYAGQFAAALRRAGHAVRVQTIDEADTLASRSCDVQLVLRGLEPVRRTPGQRQVLWVISHPEALDAAECEEADLVLVASDRFADHLRSRTSTPVEVLLQATDPDHFRPVAPDPGHRHPVTIVASSRGVPRAAVTDAISAGLAPAIHGQGWEGLVDPSLVCAPYVDIERLPTVYAAAEVVLNDHWETMRHWGFVSNRIFDVLACGTAVVSDRLAEVHELFGDLVPTWDDPDGLATVVAAARADPAAAAERTAAARALVLDRHTFDHRVRELTDLLARHGLVDTPAPT